MTAFVRRLGKRALPALFACLGAVVVVDAIVGDKGLLAVAGWIAYRERSIPRALAWVVGLCLLGNLVTLVYLLIASLRAKSVEDLFRPVA